MNHDDTTTDATTDPTYEPGSDTADGARNPLSISYLLAGLAFLGVAASWALRESGVVDAADDRWLVPLTLVVVGGIGLVASVVSTRRKSR